MIQNNFSAYFWCITFTSITHYFFLCPCLQSLEDLEEQRRRKKKERMGLGSLSRVFGRGKQRKSLDPTLFDGTNSPDYYIEEDADWWRCWEPCYSFLCVCVCVSLSLPSLWAQVDCSMIPNCAAVEPNLPRVCLCARVSVRVRVHFIPTLASHWKLEGLLNV